MFSPFPINKKILVHYGHAIEHVMVFLNLVQNIAHVTFHYCQFAVRDVIQVKHIAEVRSFRLLTCEIVFVENDIAHNLYRWKRFRVELGNVVLELLKKLQMTKAKLLNGNSPGKRVSLVLCILAGFARRKFSL